MSCCGQKRTALQAGSAQARAQQNLYASPKQATPPPQPAPAASMQLRYLGTDALSLRGPRTGQIYQCSAARPWVAVHQDDHDALLCTRLFARADPL